MKQIIDQNEALYGPAEQKTFAGALAAFLENEFPQLAGGKTRQMLVQHIQEMIRLYYPRAEIMEPGQIQWTTVHKDEKASYGKRIGSTRLTSVRLDLVRMQDVTDRKNGKKLREMKKEAVARIFEQSYAQDGCMTNAEVGVLLKTSPSTVSKYAREWEQEHECLLPRRGTIHDLGPTLTHKKQIIEKLFLEGKAVGQVQRETNHSPQAIHRYIMAFKQVLLCQQKGMSVPETAFAVRMGPKLVHEYRALIEKFANTNEVLYRIKSMEGTA